MLASAAGVDYTPDAGTVTAATLPEAFLLMMAACAQQRDQERASLTLVP